VGFTADIAQDIADILSDTDEFAIPVIWTVTGGSTVVSKTCNAQVVLHNFYINDTGNAVIGTTSRIMVSEVSLKAAGFPTRDSNGKFSLKGDIVTFTEEVNQTQITFGIREVFGNYQTGMITCTLGTYGTVTPPGRTIIGWIAAPILIKVMTTPGTQKQTLANGDQINIEYAVDGQGKLPIPYLVSYTALTPFLMDNVNYSLVVTPAFDANAVLYTVATGTFNNANNGGFAPDINVITVNASIPIWKT